MIIAIFHNTLKKQSKEIASYITEFLKVHSVTVVAEDEEASFIGANKLSSVALGDIDYIISLGGDGTILRLIHRHPDLQAPIMAVNLGSLGFMADILVEEVNVGLKNLLEGNFKVQPRIVIDGKTSQNKTNFAVNEIVIHRANNPCLIDLAIHVDGHYLNTFSADGVIISTPSGSTAYSMAAGGPILTPELNALVLTPICPHTISNRPIVLKPENEIKIEYINSHDPVEVTYDGFPCFAMSSNEFLTVTLSERSFLLTIMPHHDYFATLRNKLGWTGNLRK
jgi:NAD+ kinase